MMLDESPPEQGVQHGFWLDRVYPDDRERFSRQLKQAFESDIEVFDTELRLLTVSGSPVPVLVRGVIRRDEEGKAIRFAGSVQDLTERKRHEDHVHKLAYYDALTDLPNRRMLEEKLEEVLQLSKHNNRCMAVFILDIDRFKVLNDTHGHAAGDSLLKEVARRLSETSRPADFVARLGGDEFVVVLPNLVDDIDAAIEQVERIGNRMLAALDVPYVLDVGVLHHSASIGVAVTHGDIDDVGAILKHADVALYQAKTEGRHRVCIFEPEMQARLVRRSSIEARLREAHKDGSLAIHYQPQVNRDGVLIGAEALMRWRPVEGSPISPAEFIPIAEESGFVNELGRWALEETCALLASWGTELPPDFRVAVNVSGIEFLHPDYIDRVTKILDRTSIPGRLIRLEITEASVLTDLDTAAKRMWELRSLGIEFSLDDFGTGYSSLAYLRRLPISEVKIDRSYVSRILTDPHDAAIIRSIIALCSALGMVVVAEGVETVQQRDQLVNFGCGRFQGYLFGPAVPAGAQPVSLLGGVGVNG
jgi:diguanylate cyclase (GGDEF)-like protein